MIDSRATGNFIDTRIALEQGFRIRQKRRPYPLLAVDGGEIGTTRGMVTHETDILRLEILQEHAKDINFNIIAMGIHAVILGMPWLRFHNPQIDWWRERITMSQCQCENDRKAPLEGNNPLT